MNFWSDQRFGNQTLNVWIVCYSRQSISKLLLLARIELLLFNLFAEIRRLVTRPCRMAINDPPGNLGQDGILRFEQRDNIRRLQSSVGDLVQCNHGGTSDTRPVVPQRGRRRLRVTRLNQCVGE